MSQTSMAPTPAPAVQQQALPDWKSQDIQKQLDVNEKFLEEWSNLLDKTEKSKVDNVTISQEDVTRHHTLRRKLHESLGTLAKLVQIQIKRRGENRGNADPAVSKRTKPAASIGSNMPVNQMDGSQIGFQGQAQTFPTTNSQTIPKNYGTQYQSSQPTVLGGATMMGNSFPQQMFIAQTSQPAYVMQQVQQPHNQYDSQQYVYQQPGSSFSQDMYIQQPSQLQQQQQQQVSQTYYQAIPQQTYQQSIPSNFQQNHQGLSVSQHNFQQSTQGQSTYQPLPSHSTTSFQHGQVSQTSGFQPPQLQQAQLQQSQISQVHQVGSGFPQMQTPQVGAYQQNPSTGQFYQTQHQQPQTGQHFPQIQQSQGGIQSTTQQQGNFSDHIYNPQLQPPFQQGYSPQFSSPNPSNDPMQQQNQQFSHYGR